MKARLYFRAFSRLVSSIFSFRVSFFTFLFSFISSLLFVLFFSSFSTSIFFRYYDFLLKNDVCKNRLFTPLSLDLSMIIKSIVPCFLRHSTRSIRSVFLLSVRPNYHVRVRLLAISLSRRYVLLIVNCHTLDIRPMNKMPNRYQIIPVLSLLYHLIHHNANATPFVFFFLFILFLLISFCPVLALLPFSPVL